MPVELLIAGASCSTASFRAKMRAQMVALTGERYGEIANAFRYRSEYVEGCACKPKPWSAEAKVMFDRRAVLATRTPNEEIVAAGAGEVAKLLGARRGEGRGSRHESQAEIWPGDDRAAALPSRSSGPSATPLPVRKPRTSLCRSTRFFLFRERY